VLSYRELEPSVPKSSRPIKGLGEIALRVHDLAVMQRFYQDVVGLEVGLLRSAHRRALTEPISG
jgi:catechol-2,3-dioxygenase